MKGIFVIQLPHLPSITAIKKHPFKILFSEEHTLNLSCIQAVSLFDFLDFA